LTFTFIHELFVHNYQTNFSCSFLAQISILVGCLKNYPKTLRPNSRSVKWTPVGLDLAAVFGGARLDLPDLEAALLGHVRRRLVRVRLAAAHGRIVPAAMGLQIEKKINIKK
jgi:hypothetical protein